MTFLKADFKVKKQCERLRGCGSCGRVTFNFSCEQEEFLQGMARRYSLKTMRGWLRSGNVIMAPGGRLDADKMEAVRIMREHRICCWAPSAMGCEVHWCDEACFAWLPKTLKKNGTK